MTNENPNERDETAALVDFLELFLEDRRRERTPDLASYLARFPGHEVTIAREFLRLTEEASKPQRAATGSDEPPTSRETMTGDLVARLRERTHPQARYAERGEIARGGMGAILRIWDDDLRREIASKVMLGQGPRRVASFVEEAQITGRLDHPGIVPVHDIGVDAQDRLYFSMRLVRGRELKQVIELAREGRDGWTVTRALDVILRVCEAMAYAHSKGVIHRDLKPSNVMVGEFGEVYVMDWGLARALGKADRHDIRLRKEPTHVRSTIRTLRREERENDPDSPLVTMDGDVVGTPAYMSPEQAEGRVDEVGPQSDVYSVGAMLYHLLSGRMPYVAPTQRISSRTVLAMLLNGPPEPLHVLDRTNPAELVAICEKAMARRKDDRYADMLEMARDMRAYLDGRVVAAYETGALAETKKWLVRNKALAASLGIGVLSLIAGLTVSWYFKGEADRKAMEAQTRLGETNQANQKLQVYKDSVSAEDLATQADALWPALPAMLPEMEAWMDRARRSVRQLPEIRRELELLRVRAEPYSDDDATRDRLVYEEARRAALRHRMQVEQYLEAQEEGSARAGVLRDVLRRAQADLARIDEECRRRRTWRFSEIDDQRDHVALTSAERSLVKLFGEEGTEGCIDSVQRRIAQAREAKSSLEREATTWNATTRRVAESDRILGYRGLELRPQVGLIPLGPDPVTHLEEFLVLGSGSAPNRGSNGRFVIDGETGIVLVLLPGGLVRLGSQKDDPTAPHFDPAHCPEEGPVCSVQLAPFLISKYELTQGQWTRGSRDGKNPSQNDPDFPLTDSPSSLAHPVENASWAQAREWAVRFALTLPTEAQWEYAARAGTDSPWWWGSEEGALRAAMNFKDASSMGYMRATRGAAKDPLFPSHEDGFVVSAPVGSLRANAFGLHDMAGNVAEWCADDYEPEGYVHPARVGDGLRVRAKTAPTASASSGADQDLHVCRGGGFDHDSEYHRSAARMEHVGLGSWSIGLRLVRELDR